MASGRVRQATLADIPQMAEMFAAGFIDDDVFGRFMHPKRHEYPEDWLRHWNWDLRKHLIDPAALCFVHGDDNGSIKGCCMMNRLGKGGARRAVAEPWARKAERAIGATQMTWDNWTLTDRSADKHNMEIFDRNWEDIKHHFTGSREECWVVELLCIHPHVQKRGYGRNLIQNAIEVCKAEDPPVPLAVIASEVGDEFYEKLGFREAGRADVGEMASVLGGSLKFYENHLQET